MPTRDRWDLAWRARPPEEASNFNPAFCGEMIYRAAAAYNGLRDLPFSLALTFLVLPIILHKPTRDQLPKKANATFVGWAAEHGGLLAGLPDRATRLLPVSREALLFLLQNEVMRIQQGGVVVGENPIRLSTRPPAGARRGYWDGGSQIKARLRRLCRSWEWRHDPAIACHCDLLP
jgi:Family of unknown function (DUF6521)